MLIHKDALAVSHVCSAEDTRYFLNGALFDKQGRAIATDGHVLVRFTSETLAPEDFPPIGGIKALDVAAAEDVIIDASDLKAARATMQSHNIPALEYLAIVPCNGRVTLATTNAQRSVQIDARRVDATFPNYEAVLKVKKPVRATVTLNPEYLEVIARIAKQVGARHITFTLHGNETEVIDQVMFRASCEHGTLDGAIMPMRV